MHGWLRGGEQEHLERQGKAAEVLSKRLSPAHPPGGIYDIAIYKGKKNPLLTRAEQSIKEICSPNPVIYMTIMLSGWLRLLFLEGAVYHVEDCPQWTWL